MAYTHASRTGSPLPEGPKVSFGPPRWYAFYNPGIKKHWRQYTSKANMQLCLRTFFHPTPDQEAIYRFQTGAWHFGQCDVLALCDVGTHEHGLTIQGEELIPFGFRGWRTGQKRDLLLCRGGSHPVVAFSRDWAFRIRLARHIPSMGGGVGKGIHLCTFIFVRSTGVLFPVPPPLVEGGGVQGLLRADVCTGGVQRLPPRQLPPSCEERQRGPR